MMLMKFLMVSLSNLILGPLVNFLMLEWCVPLTPNIHGFKIWPMGSYGNN